MKDIFCSLGIVLKTISFKDNQRIISVFTKDHGLIRLIVKGLRAGRSYAISITSPLTMIEVTFKRARFGEIGFFREAALVESYAKLKNEYYNLNTAGKMVRAILYSQIYEKAAPSLFLLLHAYLNKISSFENPQNLLCSFYLKILLHDGLLNVEQIINALDHQNLPLNDKYAPPQALELNSQLWQKLTTLATSRDFSAIRTLQLDTSFLEKIESFFFSIWT
jgi:recombinational DNA repair protein (RecF pathway)